MIKVALSPWRWWRWLYTHYAQGITAALALLVVVAIVMTTVNSRADARRNTERIEDNAANAVISCKNANESREASRTLWFFVADLAGKGASPQEAAYLGRIREWIGEVYQDHDCARLDKAYPLPPPPTIPGAP